MRTNTLRVRLATLALIAAGLVPAQGQAAGTPTLYRLVQGSTLVVDLGGGVRPRPLPLAGTFELTPRISPLDWDNYDLTAARWVCAELEVKISGTGFYSVSSRFQAQQMSVQARIDGTPVDLASGTVAPSPDWPVLDIVVQGKAGPATYILHLVAVPELKRCHYELVGNSWLLDECLPCGRPTILETLRGGFDLVLVNENPIQSRYHLFDLRCWVGTAKDPWRLLTGEGDYQVGGEVALRQQLTLTLTLRTGDDVRTKTFTNDTAAVERPWPVLQADVTETEGTLVSTFRLHLLAAPIREIWFSTAHGMTPSGPFGGLERLTGSDLLAHTGRVVVNHTDLLAALNLKAATEPGLDAVDVGPGGEVLFSLDQEVSSSSLGVLSGGDLLSSRGRVAARNASLIASFGLMPPAPDVELDAVQVLDNGEILFSTRSSFFSERLGLTVSDGDVLSSKGSVWRTEKELLSRFHPDVYSGDYGLDALHAFPWGEIWFSTAKGFTDTDWGAITDGDILSDQGYVVFRNLDLVGPFSPLEDLANFGLDGLFVVTDLTEPLAAPNVVKLGRQSATGNVLLDWQGAGRVFQVQSTPDLDEPFAAASPILPALRWADPADPFSAARRFYRLRQW